ncbi:MAG: right-handed parallel beta-helix repeat-containing protein [Euryarchaeota archaeon]|nr:right-handed parallel beta-helix repeat-containing protein [Euryarchaeota archaeon]
MNGFRAGFTNGGLTNGLGQTNGLAGQHRFNKLGMQPTIRRRFAAFLVALLVAGLVGSYLILLPPPPPIKLVSIDGSFGDWDKVRTLPFTPLLPSGSPLRITTAAATAGDGRLFLLVGTAGPILNGGAPSNRTMDSLHAFLDLDGDASTGYFVKGIGADARISLEGWGGDITTRELFMFGKGSNHSDWHGFKLAGSVAAACSGNRTEVEIPWDLLTGEKPGIRILWCAAGYDGSFDWAPVPLALSKPMVSVIQESLVQEDVLAADSNTHVLSLALTSNSDCTVTAFNLSSQVRLYEGADPVSLPLALEAGKERRLLASAQIPSATTFGLSLDGLGVSDGGHAVISGKGARAYVGSSPDHIVVDGAFGDWGRIAKPSDPRDAAPSSIDISKVASVGELNATFFYIEAVGDLMAGAAILEKNGIVPNGTGNGGVGDTPVTHLPPLYGEDALRIFVDIDDDPLTGYSIADDTYLQSSPSVIVSGPLSATIGADYAINVTGKDGKIWNNEIFRFAGANRLDWKWSRISSVDAACDDRRIEIGLDGMNLTGRPLVVQLKGWSGEDRAAVSVGSVPTVQTRALVPTRFADGTHDTPASSAPSPPSPSAEYIDGDWIVSDANVTQDKEIILNGNLTVTGTGNLTLSNVTLRINQTASGACSINVSSGGQLYINQGCNITSNNTYYYWFLVYGKIKFESSTLSRTHSQLPKLGGIHIYSYEGAYVGNSTFHDYNGAGMTIEYANATIFNTTFLDGFRGIWGRYWSNISVEGCTFVNCGDAGLRVASDVTMYVGNTTIRDGTDGIEAAFRTNLTVFNVTMLDNRDGVGGTGILLSYNSKVSAARLNATNNLYGIDMDYDSNATISDSVFRNDDTGIHLFSNCNATITNCTFSNNIYTGIEVSTSGSVALTGLLGF